MNQPSQQDPTTGTARSGEQTQPKGVPPSFDSDKTDDTRDAAPDAGKKPDAGKSSHAPGSGRDDKAPMQPARGDDDVMSQKQRGQP